VPVLAFAGAIAVAGAAAVLTGVAHGPGSLVVIGSGLIGIGVGASVSPALFITGFSLPSAQIQRVFALVELLRGAAAFIAPPLLLHVALTVAPSQAVGIQTAIWVCFAIAAAGALVGAAVFALGRGRLQRPDLTRWDRGEEPAIESPPLAAGVRANTPLLGAGVRPSTASAPAPARHRQQRRRPQEHRPRATDVEHSG
jgi:dipeptide/tripeptide permease